MNPAELPIVTPDVILKKITPGMTIFLGTGASEPRTLVQQLLTENRGNLFDLEIIQLISMGDALRNALALEKKSVFKYRLKTFFAGWVARKAIASGRIDLIPCRFSRLPKLFASNNLKIDVAFIQITPPDENGRASLGISVDIARQAMEKATWVVGEINNLIPWTCGDTTVSLKDFDYLIEASEPPIYFSPSPVNAIYDKLGANVAALIPDGSCLSFSIGSLFAALGRHLSQKRGLGIHTLFFTDALMALVNSGAVTNLEKNDFCGKSIAAYAFGSAELLQWLDRNPHIEFHGIDVVADPMNIARNNNFSAVVSAKAVDLTGNIVLHSGKNIIAPGPGELDELFTGAYLSPGGCSICALPSESLTGESNIVLSVEDMKHPFLCRDGLDFVVTEWGLAALSGRTLRERALSLIDIAHPNHRTQLVQQAKAQHLLYDEQTYISGPGCFYPEAFSWTKPLENGEEVHFRPIKPSDVDDMRRLFYRFSKTSVYHRYFMQIKAMPHYKMQDYVNIDYQQTLSIVGLVGTPGESRIIAEARYCLWTDEPYAEVAFLVDEDYQGMGVSTHLLNKLIEIALSRGIKGFSADVMMSNAPMVRVFQKCPYPVHIEEDEDLFSIRIPFEPPADAAR